MTEDRRNEIAFGKLAPLSITIALISTLIVGWVRFSNSDHVFEVIDGLALVGYFVFIMLALFFGTRAMEWANRKKK